jgi:hypothetical protein
MGARTDELPLATGSPSSARWLGSRRSAFAMMACGGARALTPSPGRVVPGKLGLW